jgi:hypothetical protein
MGLKRREFCKSSLADLQHQALQIELQGVERRQPYSLEIELQDSL